MELVRIKERMKGILLNDPEWNYFIDSLKFQDVDFGAGSSTTEEGEEVTVPVLFDGGSSLMSSFEELDGGAANSQYDYLEDGVYDIITPGVTSGGARKLIVVQGDYNFDSFPEGVEFVVLRKVESIVTGEDEFHLAARLLKNITTSYSNVKTVNALVGLMLNNARIDPDADAVLDYIVRLYKTVVNGKTVICSDAVLYPSSQGNQDVITYQGTDYTVVGYCNGVVETNPALFFSGDFIDLPMTRTLKYYSLGTKELNPESSSPLVLESIKRALPLVKTLQEYSFNISVSDFISLSSSVSNSPFILNVYGNDSYTARLIQVETHYGSGISLVGGVEISGTAPSVIAIAFGDNFAVTTNTAKLVIDTDHCGSFTINIIQVGSVVTLIRQFYEEEQVKVWFNIPNSLLSAYNSRKAAIGNISLESNFQTPCFKLSPFEPFSVAFATAPYGSNETVSVSADRQVPFNIDLDTAYLTESNKLTEESKVSGLLTAHVSSNDLDVITGLYLRLNYFAFTTSNLMNKVFRFKTGIATVVYDLYTNLALSALPARSALYGDAINYDPSGLVFQSVGMCHYRAEIPIKPAEPGEMSDRELIARFIGFGGALLDLVIQRPAPEVSGLLITYRTSTGLITLWAKTNFVDANIAVHWIEGGRPMGFAFYLSNIPGHFRSDDGALLEVEGEVSENGEPYGWIGSYNDMQGALVSRYGTDWQTQRQIDIAICYADHPSTFVNNVKFDSASLFVR